MGFTVIIPARLASTRLPNKPLADIAGMPMIVRVAKRVLSGVPIACKVVVAADDPSIVKACQSHDIQAIMTRTDHPSGSDRLAEACDLLGLADSEIVVNVQGDEPLIDTSLVQAVADTLLSCAQASIGTAAHAIEDLEDFKNPNVVKVVMDKNHQALYFSRAPIAWWRDGFAQGMHALPPFAPLRHIGIYAYRVNFLRNFPKLEQSPLEIVEALEQLRAMWHGYRIAVHVCGNAPAAGVDTPQDLERVRRHFLVHANDL
jgi:3-deoxy-manno-octulosonate cytidylyltransferase (CMP-KDO synthetase)